MPAALSTARLGPPALLPVCAAALRSDTGAVCGLSGAGCAAGSACGAPSTHGTGPLHGSGTSELCPKRPESTAAPKHKPSSPQDKPTPHTTHQGAPHGDPVPRRSRRPCPLLSQGGNPLPSVQAPLLTLSPLSDLPVSAPACPRAQLQTHLRHLSAAPQADSRLPQARLGAAQEGRGRRPFRHRHSKQGHPRCPQKPRSQPGPPTPRDLQPPGALPGRGRAEDGRTPWPRARGGDPTSHSA